MIFLALGSNLGDRAGYLAQARAMLEAEGVTIQRVSSVVETPALLPENAPAEWNIAFLNQVLRVETSHPPMMLLEISKRIEQRLGRQDRGRWSPREIDVDILTYHEEVMDTPVLQLPHPQMHRRDFVLKPLAEIAPEWRYPGGNHLHGRTPAELLALL